MDLSFIVTPVLQLVGTAAAGVGLALVTYAVGWVRKKTKLDDAQFESVLADRANDIIHRGIQYGIQYLENEAKKPGSGITSVKVDNFFMRIVIDYAARSMPEIIARFGLTPERIRDMVLARIGDYRGQVQVEGAVATMEAATAPVAK